MKRLVFLLAALAAFATAAHAADVNYFEVSSSIAQPVTIKTNLGTYSFRNSYTLYGHISSLEAFDAYGNRIINTQPYKYERGTNGNKNWYRFTKTYSSGSSSSSSGGGSSYGSSSGSFAGAGNAAWENFRGAMTLASYSDDTCNLQIRAGWSSYMRENVTAKLCLAGLYISGCAGKYILDKPEVNPTRWSLGAGQRIVLDDISSDLCYGLKAANRGDGVDGFLDAEWTTWLFDSIFGIYANIGVGTPYDSEYIFVLEKFYFDFQIGLTLHLFGW